MEFPNFIITQNIYKSGPSDSTLTSHRSFTLLRPVIKHLFQPRPLATILPFRNMAEETVANGKFCLADYDAVGFDLDHTVARYIVPEMISLSYRVLANYLVKNKGYDNDMLRPFEEDKEFCTKGIIFEKPTGNFLKLDENGKVLRASHGTKFMTDAEIEAEYGADRKWQHSEDLIKNVNNADSYMIFENYFDMVGTVLFARMVDVEDKKNGGKRQENYQYCHKDAIEGFNNAYKHQHFSEDVGGFFPEIKRNTEKYVFPRTNDVKQWLRGLKKAGKVVFLLTTSYIDFADHVATSSIGEDWESYFDIICCHAQKPSFFKKNTQFCRIEGFSEKEPVQKLEPNKQYSKGNISELAEFLKGATGKENPKVAFVGDSLRSDVFPGKVFANWETILILEEMETEGMVGCAVKGKDRVIEVEVEDDEPKRKKLKTHQVPDKLETEILSSSLWGSFFYDDAIDKTPKIMGSGNKHMNTFWGYLIRRYADICIPQLDYMADFPLSHKYDVFDHEDENTSGFYPGTPRPLKLSSDSEESKEDTK